MKWGGGSFPSRVKFLNFEALRVTQRFRTESLCVERGRREGGGGERERENTRKGERESSSVAQRGGGIWSLLIPLSS